MAKFTIELTDEQEHDWIQWADKHLDPIGWALFTDADPDALADALVAWIHLENIEIEAIRSSS